MEAFQRLDAVAVPLGGANIDTDQILPARYLQKPRVNNFGDYLFLDVRRDPQGARRPGFVLNDPIYVQARILVAGPNFGCGSSREQAVWALHDGGIRAVIAPSFGDIFYGNSLKNGLLPVVLPAEAVEALLQSLRGAPGAHVCVDLVTQTVSAPGLGATPFPIDAFPRDCLLQGMDEIDHTLTLGARIEAFEKNLDSRGQ
jgi:3-isopropylmalate/(R)-2-methylmalate dehydratase small subunit